jgi:hypothetical protein
MRRELGDGLILRRATPADAEALAAFNGRVFGEPGAPNETSVDWTLDLIDGSHPTTGPDDFTLVEDTRTGAIVSSMVLIAQTWSYDGIAFGVGRPELVGTHPDYRRRGLVRAQFDAIHSRSAERGQQLQAITGIPWFYRQFGYEMALENGGGRYGYPQCVPGLPKGRSEPYRLRAAAAPDLPFIDATGRAAERRHRVACVRDLALWRYELSGRRPKNTRRFELFVIESPEREPVGFMVHPPNNWGDTLVLLAYELREGVSWLAVTPSVLRYLGSAGARYAARDAEAAFVRFALDLGTEHPAYRVAPEALPQEQRPYAWYLRVPETARFLEHVGPALEERLARSVLAGHTGELCISFYREGVRLEFKRGRLGRVERWSVEPATAATAFFPDRTFLQLLFGYRSLEELEHAFADCRAEEDATRALLSALFPKQASNVYGVS